MLDKIYKFVSILVGITILITALYHFGQKLKKDIIETIKTDIHNLNQNVIQYKDQNDILAQALKEDDRSRIDELLKEYEDIKAQANNPKKDVDPQADNRVDG